MSFQTFWSEPAFGLTSKIKEDRPKLVSAKTNKRSAGQIQHGLDIIRTPVMANTM